MRAKSTTWFSLLLAVIMCLPLAACGSNTAADSNVPAQAVQSITAESTPSSEEDSESVSVPVNGAASISNISSFADVPLVTLNNGVQVPQPGLGTQIQRLESDSSESGRKLLNDTSHDAVVAALQAGYRHLDTAHGYFNERGVGQGIIDSGIPREEIWATSKLWPSEYGNAAQAIDDMLERLQLEYLDRIYLHHPAGDYMAA